MVIDTVAEQNCINCSGSNSSHWCQGEDLLYLLTDQKFEYVTCNNCGVIYLKNRVKENLLSKIYPVDYAPYMGYSDNKGQPKGVFKIPKPVRKLHKFLGKIIPKLPGMDNQKKIDSYYDGEQPARCFLDFGCGSDKFLSRIAEKGWITTGMDFNIQTINTVIAGGHKGVVYDTELAWDQLQDNSFDFVRMNHVLEHLYHPKTVLNALYKKLKPGGILHIAVPNASGLSAQEFKSSWLGLDCPRHVIFYPPEILAKLLKDIGFSAQELVFEDVQKDYVRSLGFVKYKQGLLEHKYIEGLMYNKDLMRRYMLKFKIAALRKKSDRFHIFARK